MVLTNFSIDNFSALIFEGNYLDLHNNFDFNEFIYNDTNKTAELNFKKSNGDWVPESTFKGFKICFMNVESVHTQKHHDEYPIEYIRQDGCTIDSVGFSYGGDEIMDWPSDIKAKNDLPSLIFVFVTGRAIKITAETAQIIITQF